MIVPYFLMIGLSLFWQEPEEPDDEEDADEA